MTSVTTQSTIDDQTIVTNYCTLGVSMSLTGSAVPCRGPRHCWLDPPPERSWRREFLRQPSRSWRRALGPSYAHGLTEVGKVRREPSCTSTSKLVGSADPACAR